MTRFIDFLSGALTGMLAGVVLCAILAPDAWTVVPTPRPSPHAELGPGTPGMTTEPSLPSPDVAGSAGTPDPQPAPAHGPTPSATGTRPAATAKPRTATPPRHSLSGNAVWYDYRPGHAAAGPRLRRALGAGWRGAAVTVCAGPRCVRVVLSDWCACRTGNRLIDLDRRAFAALAAPSRGVIPVEVSW